MQDQMEEERLRQEEVERVRKVEEERIAEERRMWDIIL